MEMEVKEGAGSCGGREEKEVKIQNGEKMKYRGIIFTH